MTSKKVTDLSKRTSIMDTFIYLFYSTQMCGTADFCNDFGHKQSFPKNLADL